MLLSTALWVSEDPEDKETVISIKDDIMRFIKEKKTEGLLKLCRSILIDVLEHFF